MKGLIYLIRAYDLLLKDFPELQLVVIGKLREGPTSKELDKKGIREKVKFVSDLTSNEIAHMVLQHFTRRMAKVLHNLGVVLDILNDRMRKNALKLDGHV